MSVNGSIDLNSTNGECIYFEYHLLNCKSGTGVQVIAHKNSTATFRKVVHICGDRFHPHVPSLDVITIYIPTFSHVFSERNADGIFDAGGVVEYSYNYVILSSYRGYADTPILRACAAYAGGKAMERILDFFRVESRKYV